jgi:uncharacterized protein YgbK (DUF1537 family)
MLFEKVDSRLKGHIATEAAALAAAIGAPAAALCPAIPELGRVLVGGRLAGFGVATPIDAATVKSGATPAIRVEDAETDEDLDRIADRALAEGALMAGARGLAAALTRRTGSAGMAEERRLEGPMAIAIGSRDPITVELVARLQARWPEVAVVEAPNGRAADAVPEAGVVVLQATPAVAGG